MDLYARVVEYLLGSALLRDWPEAVALLQRAAAAQDHNWQLPVLACQAVGGTPEQALPAVVAIVGHQIGIILVDDMLDADPRGWHQQVGQPLAANLALAFQAVGALAALEGEASAAARLAVQRCLSSMAVTVAHGQALDVRNPADEAGYWRLIALKSGPFFGAALEVGALLGGGDAQTAAGLYQLGHVIGEMIQLHDDLNDTLAAPANPDWLTGRLPLPILFAQTVLHPDRERFLALCPTVADPAALQAAQEILISCGAVSYCVFQLQARERTARVQLAALPLEHPAGLHALLDELLAPVNNLLAVP